MTFYRYKFKVIAYKSEYVSLETHTKYEFQMGYLNDYTYKII